MPEDAVVCRQYAIQRRGIIFSYYHESCYKEDRERLASIDASMPYYKFQYRSLKTSDIAKNGTCSYCHERIKTLWRDFSEVHVLEDLIGMEHQSMKGI